MKKNCVRYGNVFLLAALVFTGCATTAQKTAILPWKAGSAGTSVSGLPLTARSLKLHLLRI